MDRFGLALERMFAFVGVADGCSGEVASLVVYPDTTRRRERLHPRCRVDGVARDHSLADRTDVDGDLAGHDADPHGQPRSADLLAHRSDSVDEVEAGPDRALRVVLVRDRYAPHRHHGVADELLDDAAITLDDGACLTEVARQ